MSYRLFFSHFFFIFFWLIACRRPENQQVNNKNDMKGIEKQRVAYSNTPSSSFLFLYFVVLLFLLLLHGFSAKSSKQNLWFTVVHFMILMMLKQNLYKARIRELNRNSIEETIQSDSNQYHTTLSSLQLTSITRLM